MVILTSRMYRLMSLPKKAIKTINDGAAEITDHQMQTDLKLELARCKLQQGKLTEAHQLLGETLPRMTPGPQAHQVAYELASLCVQVNSPKEAIIITKSLLNRTDDLELKRKAFDVLGKAYLAMNDYEQAAAAFTGIYKDIAGATE
jgi:tetratricopeptide (TPR) repeat protein